MHELTALLGRRIANGRNPATMRSRLLECHLALPTQDATNYTLYPFPEISRSRRIIPLAHIRVDHMTSPIALPLFKVTDAVEAGTTRFTYLGNNPLYTIIQ